MSLMIGVEYRLPSTSADHRRCTLWLQPLLRSDFEWSVWLHGGRAACHFVACARTCGRPCVRTCAGGGGLQHCVFNLQQLPVQKRVLALPEVLVGCDWRRHLPSAQPAKQTEQKHRQRAHREIERRPRARVGVLSVVLSFTPTKRGQKRCCGGSSFNI